MGNPEIHGLPRLQSFRDIATFSRLPPKRLWSLLFSYRQSYAEFWIEKKAGGYRRISHPNRTLQRVQRTILKRILDRLHVGPHCHGFSPGSRLVEHATQHSGARALLSVDIESFFPSIGIARVARVFRAAGYDGSVAMMLAYLCTHRATLPQGAPSSPKLANLACYRLDLRLSGYASKRGLVYTRYADDMSFSGPSAAALAKSLPMIRHIVATCGFRLNDRKTRLAGAGRALRVTGLTVASGSVGIGRQRLRVVRAMIHRFHCGASDATLAQIQGQLDHISDVDTPRYEMLVEYVDLLVARNPASALANIRTRKTPSTRTSA